MAGVVFAGLGALVLPAASPAGNELLSLAPATNGWMRVTGRMLTNQAVTLQTPSDLRSWAPLALLDFRQPKPDTYNEWWATNETFGYWDAAAPGQPRPTTRDRFT